uniref:Uncharacterized protein n=1 Tax=viral metagenome TaxID=1070528 RepID=A0A6M3M0H2_9ZZZZ
MTKEDSFRNIYRCRITDIRPNSRMGEEYYSGDTIVLFGGHKSYSLPEIKIGDMIEITKDKNNFTTNVRTIKEIDESL